MRNSISTMKNFFVTCCLLAGCSAHTIFTQLWVNGVAQGHTKGIRVPVNHNTSLCRRTDAHWWHPTDLRWVCAQARGRIFAETYTRPTDLSLM
jgi:hypothetical protein